jgi:tetratricopeptide (TPR) repeat protein
MNARSLVTRRARRACAVLMALALAPFAPTPPATASPSPPPPKTTSPPQEMPAGEQPPAENASQQASLVRAEAEKLYRKGFEESEAAKKDLAGGKGDAAKKKFAKALKKFERAVELDPTYYQSWNMVGFCSRKGGDLKRAFDAYLKCLTIEPEYAEAHEYLGEAYVMSGDLAKAKEQLAWLKSRNSDEAGELAESIEAAEKGAPPAGGAKDEDKGEHEEGK